MAFEYLRNTPLDQARHDYLACLERYGMQPKTEDIAVENALGRVCFVPVYAHISAPHYHACAMDGIAVKASDTYGATETTPVTLASEQYVVVDTGDPLPEGCDAVVMIEDVLRDEGATTVRDPSGGGDGDVRLLKSAAPWQNIRQIGEDICAGEMLLPSNSRIEPATMGAMLAAGITHIEVFSHPKVAIIPTGDEVILPTEHPGPGDIMEFNSTIFSGMVRRWGGEPVTYPIVKDTPGLIVGALRKAVGECDVVLINAGSSAGRDDYTAQAISAVGDVVLHGIAIKPGKPTILGHAGGKPIIGVPGYPVSGIVVLQELLKPIMEKLAGLTSAPDEYAQATLSRQVISTLKYEEFIQVRLGNVGGTLIASPLPRGAGVVTSFVKSDSIVSVAQNEEGLAAGSAVEVRLLRPRARIDNSLVVIGSHDPLIDEVAELMRQRWPEVSVASTHVGSMGAIMSARRHENHCGGIHLLDEETGTYNEAYLRTYFPEGGVRQVECVYRQQGLMVAPGNPKGITSLSSLTKPGMRYVNRQRGSGTRILCDYLCKQEDIDPRDIYGYDREEFTHTAVAALVEADSADAGMGIYSAARMYDLGFVSVCEEQYDLLIPDYAWDDELVAHLLETLASTDFITRMEQMGGYRLEHPGTVRRHYR